MNDIANMILNNKGKTFAIIAHVDPDGDTLGAVLGLSQALKENGYKTITVCDGEPPFEYGFMPDIENLVLPENVEVADIVIALDCADLYRMGSSAKLVDKADITAVIDHHESNNGFSDFCYIMPDSSSTCELVLQLIKLMDFDISKETATCLFIGLSTDTGNFSYSNTNENSFIAAALLKNKGLDIFDITNRLYRTRTYEKTKLIGIALRNLRILMNGMVSVIRISQEDMDSVKASSKDFEGLIDYARDIAGVEIAMCFRQIGNNKYKVSMRSNSDIDVCKVAATYGGGGHSKAAGCSVEGDIDELESELINRIAIFG